MSRRPFYKRYPGDFAMGTRDLTLEERGAYNDVLDLMYDKGRPIPDEPRWISGFLGISPRKWGQIRASLIAAGKLVERGEYLSNPRFERELELDEAEHRQAVEWGRRGGQRRAGAERSAREVAAKARQLGLGLEDDGSEEGENGDFQRDSSAFSEGFRDEKPEINGQESQISANGGQAPLKPARATIFQSPERESYDSLGASGEAEPPPKPKPKARPARGKAKKAAQIPKKWEPAPLTEEVEAIVARWPEGMLLRELARFKDHAASKGRLAKDWNAAWRNWIRKADDDWKRAGARPLGKPSGWNFKSPG